MADPDKALIEAIAAGIRSHRVECYTEGGDRFGWQCLTCGGDSGAIYRSIEVAEQYALGHSARAAYTAMVEHLGLVEEVRLIPEWVDLGPCDGACQMVQCHPEHRRRGLTWTSKRRLVSRWTEVDHGSE